MKQLAPRKADWKNHFAYHYLVYIIGCVAACLVWSLLFSVSKPETPMGKRVELFFVGLHDYNEADVWATGISGHLGEDQEVSYLTVPEPDAVMEEPAVL